MLARLQALGLIIRLPAVMASSGGGLLLAAGLADGVSQQHCRAEHVAVNTVGAAASWSGSPCRND